MESLLTDGTGTTVTVISVAEPTQEAGAFEVGVTAYTTDPVVVPLALVSAWLMVSPELADWPVMLPVTVPIVHANELAVLAVRLILGPEPLQALAEVELVTDGVGNTVTVILAEEPGQALVADEGVTTYTTEPTVASLGLVNTWLMAEPEPTDWPVMLPVLVPKVQAKLLGMLAVRLIFGEVPLQVLSAVTLVSVGEGITITEGAPLGVVATQPLASVTDVSP
jgi:hypothetical protein